MTRSRFVMVPSTGFEDFLYAPAEQECRDGMPVSVLSALARQDLDPWEEAATMSHMPQQNAVDRLASLLGHQAPQTAVRLIGLLPRPEKQLLLKLPDNIKVLMASEHKMVALYAVFFFLFYIAVGIFDH
jgi:hypothetical protein